MAWFGLGSWLYEWLDRGGLNIHQTTNYDAWVSPGRWNVVLLPYDLSMLFKVGSGKFTGRFVVCYGFEF
jgi:hypothetical protein